MEVEESPSSLAYDDALKEDYIDSLPDPLLAIARKVIPADAYASEETLSSETSRGDALELGLRSCLFDAIKKDPNDVDSISSLWQHCLLLCLHLVHFSEESSDMRYKGMSFRKLPFILVEDILASLSRDNFKKFWVNSLEPSLDALFSDVMWRKSNIAHTSFLRICNIFMKGLDAPWNARVLKTLSIAFEVADRSAFGRLGVVVSDNVTDFEDEGDFREASTSSSIDYSLYQAFWMLQKDFSKPNKISFDEFPGRALMVLAALEAKVGTVPQAAGMPSQAQLCETPKYLTSAGLLPLQLGMKEFRTNVATQFLILFRHLADMSSSIENKVISKLHERARSLLEKDNPEHLQILESIFKREQKWREWKKEKCDPSFFAPLPESQDTNANVTTTSLESSTLNGNSAGAEEAYAPITDEDLRSSLQGMAQSVPSLDEHLQPYVDALDPEAGIEDEYHPKNDPVFCWRATRLFAKKHLAMFEHMQGGDFERMTRMIYEEKGSTIPGEMPPPLVLNDDEDDKESVHDVPESSEVDDADMNDDNDDNNSDAGDHDGKDEVDGESQEGETSSLEAQDDRKSDVYEEELDGDSKEVSPGGSATPGEEQDESQEDEAENKNMDDSPDDHAGSEEKTEEPSKPNKNQASTTATEEDPVPEEGEKVDEKGEKTEEQSVSKDDETKATGNKRKRDEEEEKRETPKQDAKKGRRPNKQRRDRRRQTDRESQRGDGRRDSKPPPSRGDSGGGSGGIAFQFEPPPRKDNAGPPPRQDWRGHGGGGGPREDGPRDDRGRRGNEPPRGRRDGDDRRGGGRHDRRGHGGWNRGRN